MGKIYKNKVYEAPIAENVVIDGTADVLDVDYGGYDSHTDTELNSKAEGTVDLNSSSKGSVI